MPVDKSKTPLKKLRFIFIAPVMHEEFYGPLKKGMEDAAALMDVEVAFEGTHGVDIKEQVKMMAQAVSAGYDGLAVNMIHSHAFDETAQAVMNRGVPLVAFNTDAGTHNARLAAVSQDLVLAGKRLGARAARFVSPKGTVLITMHDPGISSLEQRRAGIEWELAARGIRYRVVLAHWTSAGSAKAISKVLKKDPSIQFVCATGLADTEGAGQAVEREFQGTIRGVAGFDLSPEILRLIKSGIIKFTLDQQPYLQGFYPVVQLAFFCRYGLRPSDVDAGAAVVTKRGVNKVMELVKLGFR